MSAPLIAQQAPVRTPLWAHGAPGFEDRAGIPERVEDYWTKGVNNPGITAFLPAPANATGTAIVVVPGGGHQLLVTTTEGDDVGRWLAHRGIAAFVVRYRLFREAGSPYTLEDARADVERAVRSVRARAAGDGIDPHRIGIWGFSAGGELARMAAFSPPVPARGTPDAIDALSARPDFAILEFPGPLHAAEQVSADSPPLLLGAANDDACCSAPTVDLLQAYRKAGASVEIHLYAAGGHAFNLGEDTPLVSLQHWPQTVLDWLSDRGLLGQPAPVFTPK
ncbi:alpha/beta hydrolase [Hephaestia sp. GCM10023244]|uniref:alpha/beta hydrolase n=1 Tax=unclassified Hephaestia TaxID=2631281 RepID=UPI0020770741|nr:alpha/beta hydrolase [Hephaestia sp. MAHUQ-44]MCM8730515.1 alpha/beta hydrolase [Hephaestia sp. MAHUQ-44]